MLHPIEQRIRTLARCALLWAGLWAAACSSGATTNDDAGVTRDANAPAGIYPCRADGDGTTTLVFVNRCGAPVETRGSELAGFTLEAGGFTCVDIGTDVELLSAKRYWGFVSQDPGGGRHTLAELTFNTEFNDFDWYNISHVDAHNLTMSLAPLDRTGCDSLICDSPRLLADCPEVGRYEDAEGALIACVSPERDDADSAVARHFESCDDAYAWSGDDAHGSDTSPVRACAGEDWEIVFCP